MKSRAFFVFLKGKMNIIERVTSIFSKKTALSDTVGWRSLNSTGGYVTPTSVNEQLNKITDWVFANLNAVSRSVAKIDYKLMEVKGENVDEVVEDAFLDLIYRPNPFMTKTKFVKVWAGYFLGVGEAPIRLRRKNPNNPKEQPYEMWPINPAEVTVIKGITADGFELIAGFEYRHEGTVHKLNPWEVIFINNPDLRNIWKGKGVIGASIKTIDQLDFADTYNINFFKNSARPDAVLYTEQQLTEETRKRITEGWRSAYGGNDNAHKTALLEAGLKLEKFQNSAKDMDFVEQQRMGRDKLISLFGSNKVILSIVEDVNRANAEASEYVYTKYTADPIMEELVEHLEEFLLPLFDKNETRFLDYSDIVPEDIELKQKDIELRAKYGLNTKNELRAMLGDKPVKGGDVFINESGQAVNEEPVKYLSSDLGKYREKIIKLKNRNFKRKQLVRELRKHLKDVLNKKTTVVKAIKYKNVREKETIDTYIKAISAKEDAFEVKLKPKIIKYYDAQLQEIEKKLSGEKAVASDYLFDKETSINLGIDLMTPEIEAIILSVGTEAYELLNITRPYSLLESARRYLDKAPLKAVKSMTDTAYKRSREIISNGLKEGLSNAEISKLIRSEYTTFKKDQVELVVRSEVSRATGFAQVDAYKQSGVVEGKEWIVTNDDRLCPICAAIPQLYKDRTVRKLNEAFFKNGEKIQQVDPLTGEPLLDKDGNPKTFTVDYGDIQAEPVHPRCRCQTIPVLEPIKSMDKTDEILKELEKIGGGNE